MDLREHFLVIWRRKWVVLLVSVVVAGAVYAFVDHEQPVYQASAQLQVIPGQSQSSTSGLSSDTLFLADTYAQLATARPVVSKAVQVARLRMDETTAQKLLDVAASADVGFITVTARGSTPQRADALCSGEVSALSSIVSSQQQALLNHQLSSLRATISSLESRLKSEPAGSPSANAISSELAALYQVEASRQTQTDNQLNVVAPPHADSAPVSPTPKRDSALAFVTAFVLSSELAVGAEALSDRFRSDDALDEIRRVSGLPVLAEVPEGSAEDVIEAFRALRTSLLFVESQRSLRTVAVLSSEPATGKSFTSINLAASVAELGVRVALIDADMRRPVIHERLALPRAPGLAEVLSGRPPSDAIHQTQGVDTLMVMTAGDPVSDPPGLVTGELRRRLIDPLLQDPELNAELIIFDTPAELLLPDALAVAAHCDGTILVVDLRQTRRRNLRNALERLSRTSAQPVGIVLNRSAPSTGSARYRYRYRYQSQPTVPPSASRLAEPRRPGRGRPRSGRPDPGRAGSSRIDPQLRDRA